MVFGGFAAFLQWFRALDHQNHCKTKKNHEFWILRNNLKIVVFLVFFWFFLVFTVVLVVCCGFFVVFLGFYSGFEFLTTKTTVKTKKNHEFWILRDNLKMVVFLVFFWFFLVFAVV